MQSGMNKIADADLRRWAEEGSTERRTVIIQPELPARSLDPADDGRSGAARIPFARVRSLQPEEQAERERTVAAARQLVESASGRAPRWLTTSQAFIADLSGAELARIVESPLIRAVEPNRKIG